jgi:hypothetical protein
MKKIYFNDLAFGQGYQSLGSQLENRIDSSNKNLNPTTFAGSNPIFIQLENDLSRYVQLTFVKQIIVAGKKMCNKIYTIKN